MEKILLGALIVFLLWFAMRVARFAFRAFIFLLIGLLLLVLWWKIERDRRRRRR